MATDLDYCLALADQLTRGFDERVEYDLCIKRHTDDCRETRPTWAECDCPATVEKRVKTVRHAPLIAQLGAAIHAWPATGQDDMQRSATRVDSPFPGNFEALALIDEIKRSLASYAGRARALLGYDAPVLQGAVCGTCGGNLKLNGGAAVCIGRNGEAAPCGTQYMWQQIEDYLRGMDERGA